MRLFNRRQSRRNNNGRRSDQAAASAPRQIVEHADVPTLETRGTPSASKNAISDLIHLRLRAPRLEEREISMECLVCAEDCQNGDIVTTLPCGHIFHSACVVKWLGLNCTCPTCRFELPTDDLEYEEERKPRMKERIPTPLQEDASGTISADTIECFSDVKEFVKQHRRYAGRPKDMAALSIRDGEAKHDRFNLAAFLHRRNQN
jgi:hypothetical protein